VNLTRDGQTMNIAICHYSCPPVVGGVEVVVLQQARMLKKYGHRVKIIAGKGGGISTDVDTEIHPLLSSAGEEITTLHEEMKRTNSIAPMEPIVQLIERFLISSTKSFDILIAHNVLTMPYNLPFTYALHSIANKGLINIVSWNHDSPYFYDDYPCLDKLPWQILKHKNEKIHYVCISESRKRDFTKLYNSDKNMHVIPNGIDPEYFLDVNPSTIRLLEDIKLCLYEADLVMVQPARLHPRKNIELSIMVTKALLEKGVDTVLLLTGAYDPHEPASITYYRQLKEFCSSMGVKKRVIFLSEHTFADRSRQALHRNTVRDLYLISDVLFMPSSQEGYGLPLLEAGLVKLPIICSRIPPFKEISDGHVCLFDLDETPEEIAEKIIGMVSSSRPSGMFRRVIKEYNLDSIYKRKVIPFLESIAMPDSDAIGRIS